MGACKPKKKEIIIIPDIQKNHLQRNHIMGNVKSIISTLYYIDKNNSEDSTSFTEIKISGSIQHYNPDGYLSQILSLNAEEDTVLVKNIHYRENNKQDYWIEEDKKNSVTTRCQYEYDLTHFLTSEKIYRNDSLVMAIAYKTDAMGNAIEITQEYNNLKLRNTIKYNASGLVERIDEYDPEQKLFKYITIEYDKYGNEINRRAFRNGGNLIEYTYTQYDDKERLIKTIFEDRIHHAREVFDYSEYDQYENWTWENRQIEDQETYIRKRILYYY